MRILCKHIFASAGRKFNTVVPSLGDTLTLMQECFKNIRDVDKKIRLLEFYIFGNGTVCKFIVFFHFGQCNRYLSNVQRYVSSIRACIVDTACDERNVTSRSV